MPGPRDEADDDAIAVAFAEILHGKARRRPTADHLLAAYLHGIFPMARGSRGPIDWVEPYTRGVFELEALHVPKNLARDVRKGRFEIRTYTAFEKVMRECAKPRAAEGGGSWMCASLREAYLELFRRGFCHSVEAWLVEPAGAASAGPRVGDPDSSMDQDQAATAAQALHGEAAAPGNSRRRASPRKRPKETLVGGLYGVHLGGAFFGESMFSRPELGGSNASKVCLVHLVERLRRQGFLLLDAQMTNQHLSQFGLVAMSSESFHPRLEEALLVDARWG